MVLTKIFITVSFYSSYVAFFLACILNSLQVYLILTKTEKQMKQYSNILLQSVILDFFAASAYFICQMYVVTDGPYLFVRSSFLFLLLPGKWKCIAPGIFVTFYNLSFWSIPLQCLARYYALCRDINFPRILMFPLYTTIFIALALSGWYYVNGYVPITENSGAQMALDKLEYWKDDPDKNQFCVTRLMSTNVFVHVISLNIFEFCGMGVIIYTVYHVSKYLKSHQQLMSCKTADMHKQLGRRLHIQALVPFLCCINTVTIGTFGMSMSVHSMLILLFIPYPWITVINSIVTISSVRCYRLTIIKWFQDICSLTKRNKVMISSTDINIRECHGQN